MKIIKYVNRIAVITFVISIVICAIVGQMTSDVGTPPAIIIVCTVVVLIDMFWFMLRGLSLLIDEIISNK